MEKGPKETPAWKTDPRLVALRKEVALLRKQHAMAKARGENQAAARALQRAYDLMDENGVRNFYDLGL